MKRLLLILLLTTPLVAQKYMLVQYRWGSTPPATQDSTDELSNLDGFTSVRGSLAQLDGEVEANQAGDETAYYFTNWSGSEPDHLSQVIVSGLVSDVYIGPAVRVDESDIEFERDYYGFYVSNGLAEVFKVINDSYTNITSPDISVSNGDTLKLQIVGTTLTAWHNSTQVYSGTQSDLSDGRPGIAAYGDGASKITKWIGTVK